jgi:SAM-dependent methyltransferase
MSFEPPISRRDRWNERHATHDAIESAEPDPTLIGICRVLAPGRALDLGSGDGRNAIWLARRGWQVTAVDFSTVAIDHARARAVSVGAPDIDWQLADLLEWQPPEASFDLVLLAFIHLPADERRLVYGRAAAAVAPGGTFLVIGHDRTNLGRGVGGPQDPDVLFTAPEIVGDLPAGFRVDHAEAVRRGPGDGPQALDAVVRATRLGQPPSPAARARR